MATKVQIIGNTTISSSAGQLGSYATPAGTTDTLQEIVLCNTHTAAVSVNIWLVPSGGSRTAADQVYDDQDLNLAAGKTKTLYFDQPLSAGAQIHASASVTAVVSVHASAIRTP